MIQCECAVDEVMPDCPIHGVRSVAPPEARSRPDPPPQELVDRLADAKARLAAAQGKRAAAAAINVRDDIAQLVAWNDSHAVPLDIRMLKISEESGEATDAYLGYLGANPRKGVTNGVEAVWLELADTALAALVAIASLGGDPETELVTRIAFVKARLGLSGEEAR